MVEAADLRDRDHSSCARAFDLTRDRRISFQGKVGPRLMIITEVRPQDPLQVALVEHNHMIETFSSNRSDQSLHEGPLPRIGWSRPGFFDPHCLHSLDEISPIDAILIPKQVARSGILRKSLDQLLPRPKGGGMRGDVEVDDLPSIVSQDNETEEDSKSNGRDGEEVDRDDLSSVILQKCLPGLRGRFPVSYSVFRYR
jgi:hypothetical protein